MVKLIIYKQKKVTHADFVAFKTQIHISLQITMSEIL